MLLSYLVSWEFWRNIGVLLLLSCVAGPVLGVISKIIVSILGSGSSSRADEGYSGCIAVLVALGLMYYFGDRVMKSVRAEGYFCLQSEQLNDSGKQIISMDVFAKEAPLLSEYYNSLGRYEQQERAYVDTLQAELEKTQYDMAKAPLKAQIAQVNKEIRLLAGRQRVIEELANRLYFARYMQNLGININEEALKREMKQTQKETQNIVDRNRKKYDSRKK